MTPPGPHFLEGFRESLPTKLGGPCETANGRWWTFLTPECAPSEQSFARLLEWVTEQATLGHLELRPDADGDFNTLVVGKEAATYRTRDEAIETCKERLLTVHVLRLNLRARETGDGGVHAAELKKKGDLAVPEFRWAVELAYAKELIGVIARTSHALKVTELPEDLLLSRSVAVLLEEAQRCFHYQQYVATSVVCRSCLESALESLLDARNWLRDYAHFKATRSSRDGKLQIMIDFISAKRPELDSSFSKLAHKIRDDGNAVVHRGKLPSQDEAKQLLATTRKVVRMLFRRPKRAS